MNATPPLTATEINGVVLTEKAIERLKHLQEHDNEGISHFSHSIERGIRLIVNNFSNCDEVEIKKHRSVLTDLTCLCALIEDLERP